MQSANEANQPCAGLLFVCPRFWMEVSLRLGFIGNRKARGMTPEKPTLAGKRRRDRAMLALSSITIVAAFLLQVRADERVTPRFLSGLPLPPSCWSREFFGVKCPACGLTRSFVDLAHGDWNAACAHHRLGWLIVCAVLVQIPYRIIALIRPDPPVLGVWLPRVFPYALIAALICNWFLEMRGY
jgi:hypothetical protein